mgnify:CR=1 FL=1
MNRFCEIEHMPSCDAMHCGTGVQTTVLLELAPASNTKFPTFRSGPFSERLLEDCGLPPVTKTLRVGDAVHRALIRKAARGRRVDCPELTGQNRLGHPLVGPHRHAHVLPVDFDRDGYIDHIVIHTDMGLSQLTLRAIHSLRTLYGAHGQPWLRLRVAWEAKHIVSKHQLAPDAHVPNIAEYNQFHNAEPGDPRRADQNDLRVVNHQEDAESGIFVERFLRLNSCTGAQTWVSLTPFVAPRYVKRSGKNTLEGQVRAELASRGFPAAEIEVLPTAAQLFSEYILSRNADHSPPPQSYGHAIRLHFPQPVSGPIILGYACHYGLGLFQVEFGMV